MTVTAVLLGTWICRRFLDRRDLASLGFARYTGWAGDIGLGMLLGGGLTGPAFGVGLPNSSFGPEVGALGILAARLGIGVLWALRKKTPGRAS